MGCDGKSEPWFVFAIRVAMQVALENGLRLQLPVNLPEVFLLQCMFRWNIPLNDNPLAYRDFMRNQRQLFFYFCLHNLNTDITLYSFAYLLIN